MKTLAKLFMTIAVIFLAMNSSEAKIRFSKHAGGKSGSKFMLPSFRSDVYSTDRIAKIAIRHGRRIEKIEVEYVNRRGSKRTESIGNNDGKWSYINLDADEYITYITGRSGTLIDQLTFYTNKRRVFGPYGGSGGNAFRINIPSNAKVIGFYGKEGPSINRIGLIYNKSKRVNRVPRRSRATVIDHRKKDRVVSDNRGQDRLVRDHRRSASNRKSETVQSKRKKEVPAKNVWKNKPVVRDHRTKTKPVVRDHRSKDRVVRDHRKKENDVRDHRKKDRDVRDHRKSKSKKSLFSSIKDGTSNTFKKGKKVLRL